MKQKLVSIVIPAKDKEKNLEDLLPRLKQTLKEIPNFTSKDFEIIVVCDSCTDKTEAVARKHKTRIIKRTENPGKSKALIEGFKNSKGNIVVMMDADLSHLPEELPFMIRKILSKKEIGLVVASRFKGESDDATLIREIGGRLLNLWVNLFFGTKLTDAINGFKIFERHVFDNFEYQSDGYAIEIELIANTIRSGKIVEEIPSYEAARENGIAKSKVIKDGYLFFREIVTEGILYRLQKAKLVKSRT